MKNPAFSTFFLVAMVIALFSGCTAINHSMREPNSHLQWHASDFSFSGQVSAEASTTKILMIDWARLFKKETGTVAGASGMFDIASLPVIGNVITDRTASYALYKLMHDNEGYDVVFYPQYETKHVSPVILSFIFQKTTVKVTARLAKIN